MAGGKSSAQIGSHRLIVDQPVDAGGTDTGPAPIQLLGAALGTCIALYVQQFLHARGLPCEGMRAEVEQHGASNPSRVGAFAVRVVLPVGLDGPYVEGLERVARARSAIAPSRLRARRMIYVMNMAGGCTATTQAGCPISHGWIGFSVPTRCSPLPPAPESAAISRPRPGAECWRCQ